MTEWWTMQQGIYFGAYGGATVGATVGLLGAIIGISAARGKLGRWAVTAIAVAASIGLVGAMAGVTALLLAQPYHVYYPLLMVGGIVALVCGCNVPSMLAMVRAAEQRRMAAREFRNG